MTFHLNAQIKKVHIHEWKKSQLGLFATTHLLESSDFVRFLFFNFSNRNFVRGAYGSEIFEEFRKEYKAIWFLWSEFCQKS